MNIFNTEVEIIDNFLSKKDFDELDNLKLDYKSSDKTLKIFPNRINSKFEVVESSIDHSIIKKLQKNYHEKTLTILKKLSPQKVELYDYSEFTIISTHKDYKFPIHDDVSNKLLSGIIYIKPEKNLGTFFFSTEKGEDKKIIDWKQNRGVFFSRKEKESWHAYQGDGVSERIVLVYNLNTYRIKNDS